MHSAKRQDITVIMTVSDTQNTLIIDTLTLFIVIQRTPGNLANKAKMPLAVPHPVGQKLPHRNIASLIAPALSKPTDLKALLNHWSMTHKRISKLCASCNSLCVTL